MSIRDERAHAQNRRIAKVGVQTPLLVPSFSSCGFPSVAEIFEEMRDKLYGVCLVSASDLASGCISLDVDCPVNVQVIDSGTYEARKMAGAWRWTRESYLGVLDSLDPSANAIVVNYDGHEPLARQIANALDDFSHAPHAASDFLVKPEAPADLVNIPRLGQYTDEIHRFDLVGITAREAGDSLTQRCRTLVMLRDALFDGNLDLPIHVFGAIAPMEVMAYFFCGADVFDGLAWLRQAFREPCPTPIEATAFEGTNWNLKDWDLNAVAWTANLGVLYRLQTSLQSYASTGDFDALVQDFPSAIRAARPAELAGAIISTERGA